MEPKSLLKTVYLFRDAAPQDLAAVAEISEPKVFMAGEYIYHSGTVPAAFFVIESGTIDVTLKDKEVPVGSVGADQVLGELAFFDRRERIASALARERTHVLVLSFAKLDRVLAERSNLALGVYRRACSAFANELRTVAPDLNRRYL